MPHDWSQKFRKRYPYELSVDDSHSSPSRWSAEKTWNALERFMYVNSQARHVANSMVFSSLAKISIFLSGPGKTKRYPRRM